MGDKKQEILNALDLPQELATKFFQAKVNVPTERWDDLWNEQHTKGFMVAGAMKADLIQDFRNAVNAGIENGESLDTFRAKFDDIVKAHGWDYHGSRNWRSQVIFDTNVRSAYAAGRWQQMTDPEVLVNRPFLEYRHGDSIKPRPLHLAWNKKVLPANDPWWDEHYPPGGYGCKCKVYSLSKRDLARRGKSGPDTPPDDGTYDVQDRRTGEMVKVPKGIDPGFAYNVGKDPGKAGKVLGNLLDRLDPDLRKDMLADLAKKTGSKAKTRKTIIRDIVEELTPAPTSDGGWSHIKDSQKGSNLGGLYIGPDGEKYYVKFYQDIAQAHVETVAQAINKEMGLAAPDLKIIEMMDPNGKMGKGLASKWIDGLGKLTAEEMAAHPDIAKAFHAAVLTKNWDIVGLAYDNLMVTQEGKLICIDAGGSLTYRAQGGLKAFGPDIGEVNTLRTPSLNKQAADVFNRVFSKDVFAEKDGMSGITKRKIAQILKSSELDPSVAADFKKVLGERMDALVDRYNLDGSYTYDGFGKHLDEFKKWGTKAPDDREQTGTGAWTSYRLKQEMDSLVRKFEKYVDDKITMDGATVKLKTMLQTNHGWSGNSSNAGGAVMKKWAIDFFPGTEANLYQHGTDDALKKVQDAARKFMSHQSVDQATMDELLKAEYEFQQYYLTRLNGYDPFQVERGMREDEFRATFKTSRGKADYQNGGMYSTTNSHDAWTGTDRRISIKVRNENVFKTWYQGRDYMHYGSGESEFVIIGKTFRAEELTNLGSNNWSPWKSIE